MSRKPEKFKYSPQKQQKQQEHQDLRNKPGLYLNNNNNNNNGSTQDKRNMNKEPI